MRRRDFIAGLGGVAAMPFVARAQAERMKRIGVIMGIEGDDPQIQRRMVALHRGLHQLGWVEGRNLRVDFRSGSGAERLRKNIAELIALGPDILLSGGAASLGPLLQATRTIPVVFANVADPVGAGFIDSLAQPGGNATGFLQAEYGLSAKMAELLKELAPDVTRIAVLRDTTNTAAIGQFAIIQYVAPSLGLDVRSVNVRRADEISLSRCSPALRLVG